MNTIKQSQHFAERQAGRHLTDDQIDFALLFGTRLYCGGARACIVRRQDIPAGLDPKVARTYHGTVVIVTLDSTTLITAYRSEHAYSDLKKKFRN